MTHKGMQIINAARKMMNPTVPFRIPPTKGIKPRIVVMGDKNKQIPATIMTYDKILIAQVIIFDLDTALSIISDFDIICYSTRLISSMGLSKSAIQFEMQQHAGS